MGGSGEPPPTNILTLNAPLLFAVKFSSHQSESSLQDCYRT
jgi:hypothetical protein